MTDSIFTYFSGSTPGDFTQAVKNHPFSPYPQTPNYAVHSIEFSTSPQELFEIVKSVIHQISPHMITVDSPSLQIGAVFRIPFFGFKDDVSIMIHSPKPQKCIFHIKSASRVGRGDFGVNRRRIKRIVSNINKQL